MRPMRSLYRRSRHNVPTLNMASMPDLIFTVLFFFMIVTHMRSDELKVRLEVPQGTEVQKLSNKAAVVNIYIGRLTDQAGRPGNWGVQLNGDVISPEQIASRIEELRSGMSADASRPSYTHETHQRCEARTTGLLCLENQLRSHGNEVNRKKLHKMQGLLK